MNNNKILITGGAGYIGSHIYLSLLQEGFDPIIFDNLSRSNANVIKRLEQILDKKINFVKGDLLFKKELIETLAKNKIETIIHLAGFKSIEESVNNPMLYYQNNLVGLINLIDAALKHNCKHFLFSSSASIYDTNIKNHGIKENHIQNATNPYSATKQIAEKIIIDVSINSDLTYSILRYFNPAGAHSSGLIGDNFSLHPSNLFPIINMVAKKELSYLKVFGNDYDTPDGTAIRDYIHISDLAEGHVLSIKKLISENESHILNLGSGKGYSVLDVVNCFNSILDNKIEYKFFPRRQGDKGCIYADINLARNILKWEPKKTLEEMCQSSWNVTSKN